jgi:hypothetical protein
MSEQLPMFVEDLNDAIRDTVKALGGFQKVGYDMQPEKGVEGAGRWLSDCCNPDRREKLSPEQLAYIRKRARQQGVHILAAFEARDAGYAPPKPIEPEDERAALLREFNLRAAEVVGLSKQLATLGVLSKVANDA